MPTFSYKAKDRSGNTVSGSLEADTESKAAAMIREMGHLPMDIRATAQAAAHGGEAGSAFARYLIYPLWTGVNIRALMFFYRQMATMLSAGMTLSESLQTLRGRTRGRLKIIIDEMHSVVSRGGQISSVIARYPKVFSQLQVSLVRVGESGGLLEQMFDRIASYLEYEIEIRQRIAKATFYPVMILLFVLLKPVLVEAFLSGWPAAQVILISQIRHWIGPIIIGIIVLKLVMQFRGPRFVWDFIKIQPPVLGTTARKIAMSRFSRALAILYGAGLAIAEAVSTAADASANLAIGNRIKAGVPALHAGEGLTATLEKTGAILPMVMDMLAVGERTGGMDSTLQKVSDYMDDETDATIHKLSIALFVLMILVAGVIVLMDLIKGYSGYFSKILGAAGE